MNFTLDINKAIEKFGPGKTAVGILLFLLASNTLTGYLSYSSGSSAQNNENSQNNETHINVGNQEALAISATEPIKETNKCEYKEFDRNQADWIFSEFQGPDEEGFYCPKLFTSFSSPDMWNRNGIDATFDSLKIVYEIKNKDPKEEEPPSFIFSLGNNPRLLRLYIPERNPQLIGVETISLSSTTDKMVRNEPEGIRDPIKESTQVELTVRSFVNQGNHVRYTSNLRYVSDQSGDSIEDSFSQEIQIPVPNPDDAIVDWGIGTLKGNCIKPIRYEICR